MRCQLEPQLRTRQPTECGKHLVAGMVPVPVVDALKAIEIKHDEGHRLARKACPLQEPFACLEESAMVGELNTFCRQCAKQGVGPEEAMRRREFIAVIAGAAAIWPCGAALSERQDLAHSDQPDTPK